MYVCQMCFLELSVDTDVDGHCLKSLCWNDISRQHVCSEKTLGMQLLVQEQRVIEGEQWWCGTWPGRKWGAGRSLHSSMGASARVNDNGDDDMMLIMLKEKLFHQLIFPPFDNS